MKRKTTPKTPAKISEAAQIAIAMSYCQKHFLRKEIMWWLAVHSTAGTNKVDWNCIKVKEMMQWAPDESLELEPLYDRTVQELRGCASFCWSES